MIRAGALNEAARVSGKWAFLGLGFAESESLTLGEYVLKNGS